MNSCYSEGFYFVFGSFSTILSLLRASCVCWLGEGLGNAAQAGRVQGWGWALGVLMCICVVLVDRKLYYDSRFTICLGKGEHYGYAEISDTRVDGGCRSGGRRGGFGVGCSSHEQNSQ
jgi:hypothetical protein